MNEYGSRGTGERAGSERGSIEPRRGWQGVLGLDPFRGVFPGNVEQMFGISVNRREDGYEIEMAVPGFRPEDLDVSYQDGVITVTGRNDRRSFTRSLTVPDDVDEETIQAQVENGMLILVLHQNPKRQPRHISIGTTQQQQQLQQPGAATTGTTASRAQQTPV